MKIETVPIRDDESLSHDRTQVVRLKVTGPIDASDEVLKRARALIAKTGSKGMAESFEWSLEHGQFDTER